MFKIKRLEKYNTPRIMDFYKIREEIDFAPYYQRYSNIWDDSKRRLLIDTIINGYDIPKFYFHYLMFKDNDLNKENKKFAIIDGKQRINAIFDFLQDGFELDETVVFLQNEALSLKGKKYSDLAKNPKYFLIKKNIDNFLLDIVHIVTDEFDRIEEMFLRLNEGVAVNNAEKRNSMGGYLMGRINKIIKENPFFTKKVRFSNKRMQYQDLLAKLILLEGENTLKSFTKKNLDVLIKKYKPKKKQNEIPRNLKIEADNTISKVEDSLVYLSRVFQSEDPLLRSKGIIPLYYWYIKKKKLKPNVLRSFLEKFEEARIKNRRNTSLLKANRTLLQFDRLNQQGANQSKSLEVRYRIMDAFLNKFLRKNIIDRKLELPPKEIGLPEEIEEAV